MPTTYRHIAANKRKSIFLVFIFILFVLAIGWVFGELTEFGYAGLVLAIIVALIMTLVSFYTGDKIALWSTGAKPITKEQNAYVYRMVENLSITAGTPVPKVYIINDPALNAFATGRDPEHASIALTTGIIENLENEELEGVIAHELSHIKNYDIRLMMLVLVLVGVVALMGNWFFRISFYGGGGRRSSRGGAQGIMLIIGLVFLILSPIIANLIKLAVSRKREYLADASGALLTRYPEGLAKALEKIDMQAQPMVKASNATAHLFISNPFGVKAKKGFTRLLSTHPPIEDRIKALRGM